MSLDPYSNWEPKRYYICQSRMASWLGLYLSQIQYIEDRIPTREDVKRLAREFPEDTNGCKCSECRYHRIYGGKK